MPFAPPVRHEGRDGGGDATRTVWVMFFVVVSSLSGYLSSHHWLYIIYHSLLGFIHSFLITYTNFYHHSIHSIHLEISPDPLLYALHHLRVLGLFPRPRAWDELAVMMIAWRVWMIEAGGDTMLVPLIRLSAHSLLGDD